MPQVARERHGPCSLLPRRLRLQTREAFHLPQQQTSPGLSIVGVDYCLGLLLPGERKSVEPIAAVTAPARVSAQHQSLLHFVANAPWSDERVLSRIQELTLP